MARCDDARLRRRLEELLETYGVPGASISVLADGEVVDAAAGVVNTRTGVEVRAESPFMIQSITKVWTATLVMQLVDEGRVGLDEPVSRYVPGFRTADERASAEITVRHLLTHTGGFEGDLWAATTSGEDALQWFVDEEVSRAPQHAAPGQLYSYCSAGMGVLGRLVELLRHTSYAGAFRRWLSEPLGVDGVAFDAGEAMAHRTAIGHVGGGPGDPLRPVGTWAVMPLSNPAAGNQLAMPASGLISLARLHLADGVLPDGTRLLSSESARTMREPHVPVPATWGPAVHQGLGWRLTPEADLVEHGGDTIGSGAMLRVVPDQGVAVALLANGGDMSGLVTEVLDELLGELAGVTPTSRVPVPDVAGGEDLSRYVGTYELRNRVGVVSADGAGRLWLTRSERNDAALMAALAGIRLEARTTELRRLEGERFVLVDGTGRGAGVAEFVDTDPVGRARFLHDGRAAPRVSAAG